MKVYAHDPRFVFNGRDGSFPDAVVVREIWCENVYEITDGDVADTGIVVDVGANIGSFTIFAGKLGAKKVIAIEPEPHNLKLLQENIRDNSKNTPDTEYVINTNGVAGRSGVGFITDAHGDSVVSDVSEAGKTRIELVTLDWIWSQYRLEYVDVLKIDIEGLEGEVLLAASKRTLQYCRYITIEYDQSANDLGAIVEKLTETHQVKVVGSAGGMIFARRY